MKFLCLIRADTHMERMSEADAKKHFADYAEFTAAIRQTGHYAGCNRLQPPGTAVTVRVRNGKVLTTDGPFAETKEQLGGYYLIEARDIDEAAPIASRIPGGWFGSVEVRPVAEDAETLRALGFAAESVTNHPWLLPQSAARSFIFATMSISHRPVRLISESLTETIRSRPCKESSTPSRCCVDSANGWDRT